jgi:hypothetical protein
VRLIGGGSLVLTGKVGARADFRLPFQQFPREITKIKFYLLLFAIWFFLAHFLGYKVACGIYIGVLVLVAIGNQVSNAKARRKRK